MAQPFSPSELVLHADGSVYHLNLKAEHLANTIILVGDPGRVDTVSAFFDSIECERKNREFVLKTGTYNGKRISVLATGIGTDNIDIVINELDAAVNIDLNTRTTKAEKKSLNFIRIGTCGILHPTIPVDSFIASSFGIGFDGIAHFYKTNFAENEKAMAGAFIRENNWPDGPAKPYAVACDNNLLQAIAYDMHQGITLTANGFYGPQFRALRIPLADKSLPEKLPQFIFEGQQVTNFEMETSALYFLGKTLGHKCLTVCLGVANRSLNQFSNNYHERMNKLIETVLSRISN